MKQISPSVLNELAPDGVVRAAINLGNPVLAQRAGDGALQGVSVALAGALAKELGARLELFPFDAAGKVFAAMQENVWTLAFLAIEPVRAEQIAFSEPYVIIEGTYLVPVESRFKATTELDEAGVRIAVGKGAAYDLFLSRTLKHAELERADTSAGAVDLFIERKLEAAAGVRQPLQKVAAADARFRVLSDSFTAIRQAMAVPRGRDAAAAYVEDFIARQKASGFVRKSLADTGQGDVTIAP